MTVAAYVRVSTADQNLDRQLEATHNYAVDELGCDPSTLEVYRDKSTGTDIQRSGYQALLNDAEAGQLDGVVVHEVSRIARSISDLERTVKLKVSTAFEMTEEQQQKLIEALSKKLERKVALETAVDQSLIGGVVVNAGDLVIDASVRGKLAKMARALGS